MPANNFNIINNPSLLPREMLLAARDEQTCGQRERGSCCITNGQLTCSNGLECSPQYVLCVPTASTSNKNTIIAACMVSILGVIAVIVILYWQKKRRAEALATSDNVWASRVRSQMRLDKAVAAGKGVPLPKYEEAPAPAAPQTAGGVVTVVLMPADGEKGTAEVPAPKH
ncbi:hypothetical protein HDU97_003211 [Phlyctochytrium planicorne]|nr:hypothetical protein HDU97_003211 [Phlyctochytrium planicorne]